MHLKRVVLAVVAAGVLGSATAASADILVTLPSNPVLPPTEPLVQQEAPPDVAVIFGVSPGPPNVSVSPSSPE